MHNTFRTLVRTLLTRSDMTQEMLANALGYTDASYLSKLLNGKRPLRRSQVLAMLTVLVEHNAHPTLTEANQLLIEAGFAPLQSEDPADATLLYALHSTDPDMGADKPDSAPSPETMPVRYVAPEPDIKTGKHILLPHTRSDKEHQVRLLIFGALLVLLISGWGDSSNSHACPAINTEPPHTVAAYRALAEHAYQQEQYACAVAAFEVVITTRPTKWDYYHRGVAHFYLRHYVPAIEDLTVMIEQNPTYDWAYMFRGRAYELLGEDAAAIADYQTVIQLDQEARSHAERRLADRQPLETTQSATLP